MPKSQDIEYDNSFDVGTTFTLRGNTNVFNHMYEYVKLFKAQPLHMVNMRLHRTKNLEIYDKYLAELQNAFPNAKIERRRLFELACNDDITADTDLSSYSTRHELMLVEGTRLSLHFYLTYGSSFSVDVYASTDEEFETFQAIHERIARSYVRVTDTPVNKFYMITHDGQALDLIEYNINKAKFADFDIEKQYNDDFKDVAEHIQNTLSMKGGTTGIALLHGCPGSGKTTYLRHLIATLPKRIIYLPPDMANQLGTPAFFNFIRQYPDSILIIEDSENILKKRLEGEGTAPAISNLLNLSDGIMGDALSIQIICTFNANIAEIDEALLRPGRLIANHYFGPLDEDKTKALVKHLYGEDAEPKNPTMTVAEIYKTNDICESNVAPKKSVRMGFLP
jgi:ATPases of the AAA+ class